MGLLNTKVYFRHCLHFIDYSAVTLKIARESSRTETISSKWTSAKPLQCSTSYQLHFKWSERFFFQTAKLRKLHVHFRKPLKITYHIIPYYFQSSIFNLKQNKKWYQSNSVTPQINEEWQVSFVSVSITQMSNFII